MYSLISNEKIIGTHADFVEACKAAKLASTLGKSVSRMVDGVVVARGSCVSVWSGEIVKGRGITKHASYVCGE